jgi:hypothetical protein
VCPGHREVTLVKRIGRCDGSLEAVVEGADVAEALGGGD